MRRFPTGRTTAAVVVLLVLLAVGGVLAARQFRADPIEAYCDAVVAQRAELTETLAADRPDTLLRALPLFSDLRERAPDDLAAEWRVVVTALEGLRTALDDAGVDPATYDRDDPPDGVTDAQRDRIDAAAQRVGSAATADALNGLDQQARDVCGTPLTQ